MAWSTGNKPAGPRGQPPKAAVPLDKRKAGFKPYEALDRILRRGVRFFCAREHMEGSRSSAATRILTPVHGYPIARTPTGGRVFYFTPPQRKGTAMPPTCHKQPRRNAPTAPYRAGSALATVWKAMMSPFAIGCNVSDPQSRAVENADQYWAAASDRERAELSDELHALGLHHCTRRVSLSAWAREELRAYLSGTRNRYASGLGVPGVASVGASHALPTLGR